MARPRSRPISERGKSNFLANLSPDPHAMTAILAIRRCLLRRPPTRATASAPGLNDPLNSEHLLADHQRIRHLQDRMRAGCRSRTPVLAAQMISDVFALVQARAVQMGSSWASPRGDIPRHVQTAPLRVKQILVNLLAKRDQFTQSGAVTITVTGSPILLPHDQVRRDRHGVAMTYSHIRKHVQPFTQAARVDHAQFGGTGSSDDPTLAQAARGRHRRHERPRHRQPVLAATTAARARCRAIVQRRDRPLARQAPSLRSRPLAARAGPAGRGRRCTRAAFTPLRCAGARSRGRQLPPRVAWRAEQFDLS